MIRRALVISAAQALHALASFFTWEADLCTRNAQWLLDISHGMLKKEEGRDL